MVCPLHTQHTSRTNAHAQPYVHRHAHVYDHVCTHHVLEHICTHSYTCPCSTCTRVRHPLPRLCSAARPGTVGKPGPAVQGPQPGLGRRLLIVSCSFPPRHGCAPGLGGAHCGAAWACVLRALPCLVDQHLVALPRKPHRSCPGQLGMFLLVFYGCESDACLPWNMHNACTSLERNSPIKR